MFTACAHAERNVGLKQALFLPIFLLYSNSYKSYRLLERQNTGKPKPGNRNNYKAKGCFLNAKAICFYYASD